VTGRPFSSTSQAQQVTDQLGFVGHGGLAHAQQFAELLGGQARSRSSSSERSDQPHVLGDRVPISASHAAGGHPLGPRQPTRVLDQQVIQQRGPLAPGVLPVHGAFKRPLLSEGAVRSGTCRPSAAACRPVARMP
jgi:hypothetical protein